MMMQDVMRLDNSARMNTPGVAAGNWKWRIGDEGVWDRLSREAGDLKELARVTARYYNKAQPPQQQA
jgi:4-alpha-glucanotransferase